MPLKISIPLQSSLLLPYADRLDHGFWDRHWGIDRLMHGQDPVLEAKGKNNLEHICTWFQRPSTSLITPHQVHGNRVHWIQKLLDKDQPLIGDGLITSSSDIIIGIRTADCVPLLLYDPQSHTCAALHIGWKGALVNIIEQALKIWRLRKIDPSQIIAVLGPAIDQSDYEMGKEVYDQFYTSSPSYKNFFQLNPLKNTFYMDLKGLVLYQLHQEGINLIDRLSANTYTQENFYSYRRSTHQTSPFFGNQLSVIGLKKKDVD